MRHTLVAGAVRGIVATAPMTAAFAMQRRGRVPPEEVFKNATTRLGIPRAGALWPIAHLGMGATFGALAGALRLPDHRGLRAAYGVALFLVDYGAVAPSLRLYPNLGDDDRSRRRANALSHAVFGLALAPKR